MRKKFFIILATITLTCSFSFASSVYKWRDSDGVLHFSNVAPNDGARNVEETYESKSSDYSSMEKNTKTVSKKRKRSNSSGSSKNKMSRSDCERTIKLTKESADINIETAKKNLAGGYITREQYNKARRAMLLIKNEMSVSDCVNASGREKAIYECLEKNYGYITACADK